MQSDQDFLRQHPQPALRSRMTKPRPSRLRRASGSRRSGSPLSITPRFFRNTPYETAPPVVQRTTVVRVQNRPLRLGILDGASDGQISDALSQGLLAYQRSRDLTPTGRPDMATLGTCNCSRARSSQTPSPAGRLRRARLPRSLGALGARRVRPLGPFRPLGPSTHCRTPATASTTARCCSRVSSG